MDASMVGCGSGSDMVTGDGDGDSEDSVGVFVRARDDFLGFFPVSFCTVDRKFAMSVLITLGAKMWITRIVGAPAGFGVLAVPACQSRRGGALGESLRTLSAGGLCFGEPA